MATRDRPIVDNVIRNDDAVGESIQGTGQNDHLIHHRDPSLPQTPTNTTLYGGNGDDILEASVRDSGQIHMYGGRGDDWFVLDVTKDEGAWPQGHHAFGGPGNATYQFVNIHQNNALTTGRLDTFSYANDRIAIEDTYIDLNKPPLQSLPLGGGQGGVFDGCVFLFCCVCF